MNPDTLQSNYPPYDVYNTINSTTTTGTRETKIGGVGDDEDRELSRTPSPTPSEAKELKTGAIDWRTLASRKFWFRREWLCALSLLLRCLVLFLGRAH